MVIKAADVQRWTQPTPLTAEGHVSFGFDCTAPTSAAGSAVSIVDFECYAPIRVRVSGDAPFAVGGSMLLMPNMFGGATIELDCEAVANRPPETFGVAQFDLNGTSDSVPSIEALSTPMLFSFNELQADILGVAQVSFFDYGWGSPPVFAFKFPIRFTDNLLNIQDAPADIHFDCTSFDGGGGGDAVALLDISSSADSAIILEYGNLGVAVITGVYSEASTATACLGAVLLPEFDCVGFILGQTMFPFRFPAVFWAPWQDGPAEFSLDATSPVVVAVVAPTLADLKSYAAVEVPQTGSAAIELDAVLAFKAAVDGGADLDGGGDGVAVAAGIASAAIVYDNTGTDEVDAVGLATIAMFSPLGKNVLPFQFPLVFQEPWQIDVIEALAYIIISATADDITVAGYADALAGIAAICAAVIPQTGSAALEFDTSVANVVAAEGVASMLITSTAVTVDVVVFPFRFPAMFIPPYGNPPIFPVALPILFS